MPAPDLSKAEHPKRRRADGGDHPMGEVWRQHYSPATQRFSYLWQTYAQMRQVPVRDQRSDFKSPGEATKWVKDLAVEFGADVVGIAEFRPELNFVGADELDHKFVIVFAMAMSYDLMIDIGPTSQEEVHRVYYGLNELGFRLAMRIGAYGYDARAQPNQAEFPLPAYGQLAGIGELGKHGSLISPELGSSFRLGAVSTDLPLIADGPRDHDIDSICTKCNVCERFCPGDAIKSEKETIAGIHRWYVDTPACEPYFYGLYGCKICLMVCPFNARGNLKKAFAPVAADIREAKDGEGLMKMIRERSDHDIPDIKGMMAEFQKIEEA